MNKIQMPSPISVGLILSYQCTAKCRHCMYACSPEWKGHWISEYDLELCLQRLKGKIIPSPWGDQVMSLNHGLHFTGGEPFLKFDLLLKAVQIADEFEIPSTFVETNCFWCCSDIITREKLNLLKSAGLRGILISVNPFYAEYVPFERTERCIKISREVFGTNVMVYQMEYYKRFKRLGIRKKIPLADYLSLAQTGSLTSEVELFLMGRAAVQLKAMYPKYPPQYFFSQSCLPPFLRDWHNHLDNYGNIMPGYCGGISLGDWHQLDDLIEDGIDLDKRPILSFLLDENMMGLYDFAKDLGYRELEEGYISKCHLCLDLRTYLIGQKDFEELRPLEFYDHL